MTVIISLMGRKGGITKTTLAKNIAASVLFLQAKALFIQGISQFLQTLSRGHVLRLPDLCGMTPERAKRAGRAVAGSFHGTFAAQ